MHRYGSEPIEGLTVWGKWDSELYVKHNEDVDGEHGWSHFRSESLVHHGTNFVAFPFEAHQSKERRHQSRKKVLRSGGRRAKKTYPGFLEREIL